MPPLAELALRLEGVKIEGLRLQMLAGMSEKTRHACVGSSLNLNEAYKEVLADMGAQHEAHAVRLGTEVRWVPDGPPTDLIAGHLVRPKLSWEHQVVLDVYSRGFSTEQTSVILGLGGRATAAAYLGAARRSLRAARLTNGVAVRRAYEWEYFTRGQYTIPPKNS